MNFFLNHALTSLNIALTPQNRFLMIIEKQILIIWNVSYKSSSDSPSVQVLRQQIRVLWGVKACADLGKVADVILECSLMGVLWFFLAFSYIFHGRFGGVSWLFHVCFMGGSWMYHIISLLFYRCVFRGCWEFVSRVSLGLSKVF